MCMTVGISREDPWILKATLQVPRPEAHPDPPETSPGSWTAV